MSNKNRRGGLGRGLGALIPTAPMADADETAGGSVRTPSYDAAAVPAPSASPASPASPQLYGGAPEAARDAPVDGYIGYTGSSDGGSSAPAEKVEVTDGLVPVDGARFVEVEVAAIRPNPRQPRQVFDDDALGELTHSIREFGVLQPVVVREIDGSYELVMGERRLRAATAAGLTTVPAIVRTTADDAMLRDALLENIHRAQLNPLEEAAAYQQLLEEFGATHDELAGRIGRSRPQVSNTIRLLNLPVPVQRRVAAGVLSAGHARALLAVDDADVQEDFASRIVAEGLSVRATEELVALHAHGHQPKRSKRSTGPRITAPALGELADRLSDAFDTRVRVDLGRTKGKITVEFATIDDLERIVGVMSGQLDMAPGTDRSRLTSRPEEPPLDATTATTVPAPPPASAGDDYAGWTVDPVTRIGSWQEDRYDPTESNDS